MSICYSGLKDKVVSQPLLLSVAQCHPLLMLANALSWDKLAEIVLPDLQKTAKGKWWVGRRLKLRTHLGAYMLQQLFNKTDRQIEYDINDNAAYQLFCGRGLVLGWHCPDHTKIEEFRSRLVPETQQKLANHLSTVASDFGFADPSKFDIDSTVQESNMAYPSDVHLLTQLGIKAKKVWKYLQKKYSAFTFEPIEVDLKKLKQAARACFFNKAKDTKIKNNLLDDLWMVAYANVMPILKRIEILKDYDWAEMPWNIRRVAEQIKNQAHQYFIDVCKFLNKGAMEPGKILSWHLKNVACFNKRKVGKKYQFGRAFQLGRIGGNFLVVGKNETVRMEDKKSLKAVVEMHDELFPGTSSVSVATDKGYYSKENEEYVEEKTGSHLGLQKPKNIKGKIDEKEIENYTELISRRAGIEPLIGHAKQGGQLGRSRMKYDDTILSSGYAAILGFNGRQLMRYLTGKIEPAG